jgi:hypothetical protein
MSLENQWLYDLDDSDPDAPYDADDDPEPDSEPNPPNYMPLPPENFYATENEMWTDIQAWAAQHRYAFRIGRSNTIGKDRKKVFYQCDCCGPLPVENRPRDDLRRPQHRIRSTSSKKTGCEFSVAGVMVDAHHWEIRHRPDPKFSVYNHTPSHSAMAHASHRRLTNAQVEKAKELHNIGKFIQLKLLLYYC